MVDEVRHHLSYSNNMFSPTNWYGVAAVKNDNVRIAYDKAAKTLAPGDKQGRADLKEKTRANTPEPFKSIVEKGRPMAGEQAKVNDPSFKGNVAKTNAEVNDAVKTTGTLGKIFIAGGVINSGVNIATSSNPGQQVVVEASSWAGAIQFGSTGAEIGSVLGPGGSFVGGVVGSVIGGVAGSKVGQWLNENVVVSDGGKAGFEINGKFIRNVDLDKR